MSQARPQTLQDFWEEADPGDWEIDYEIDDDGTHLVSRRQAMGGIASLIGLVGAGSLNVMFGSTVARADVASGGLSIAGDTATSDGGTLTSLTVSITSGHVSYDGLDTDAASIDVNFFAAHTGGNLDTAANRIGSQSVAVADATGLDTRAGHYDYSFTDVNVFASDDLAKSDFRVSTDGQTQSFDVDFRVELEVLDSAGALLVEGAEVTTTTITVTNEPKSGNANGSGGTNATGSNQNPGA